jgi:hypothetical protein
MFNKKMTLSYNMFYIKLLIQSLPAKLVNVIYNLISTSMPLLMVNIASLFLAQLLL